MNILRWCTTAKYLGIIVDSKLNWNAHCEFITAKAFRVLNLLRRYMFGCPEFAKKRIFRALILPILEYASPSWSAHTQKNISSIESVQLKGARWVCGSRRDFSSHTWTMSSKQCCEHLQWCPLSVRRQYLSLLFLFKIIHFLVNIKLDDYFTFTNSHTWSHEFSIRCKVSTVSAYRHSFFVDVIFFWNQLKLSLISLHDYNSFRIALYNYLCL